MQNRDVDVDSNFTIIVMVSTLLVSFCHIL